MNETEATTPAPTPKRRGRPVGSKNRPKASDVRKAMVLAGDGAHLKITSDLVNGGRLPIAKIELDDEWVIIKRQEHIDLQRQVETLRDKAEKWDKLMKLTEPSA